MRCGRMKIFLSAMTELYTILGIVCVGNGKKEAFYLVFLQHALPADVGATVGALPAWSRFSNILESYAHGLSLKPSLSQVF